MRDLGKTTAVRLCDAFVEEDAGLWMNRRGTPMADGGAGNSDGQTLTGKTPLAREVQTRVNLAISNPSAPISAIELLCKKRNYEARYRVILRPIEDDVTSVEVVLEKARANAGKKREWDEVVVGSVSWDGWIYD